MRNWYDDVKEFHDTFGLTSKMGPNIPSEKDKALRISLILEEAGEIYEAMTDNDMSGILDGAIDLIYVTLGMLVSYGIRPEAAWGLVHKANMSKEGGSKRADGKILKPDGWQPPNIDDEIEAQRITASAFDKNYRP